MGEYQDLNENGVYDAESIDRVSGFTETPNTLIPSGNDGIIVFNLDNQYYTSDSNLCFSNTQISITCVFSYSLF